MVLGLDKLALDVRLTPYHSDHIPSNWGELVQPRTPYLVDKHNLGSVYIGCYAPGWMGIAYYENLFMRRSSHTYLYSLFESTRIPSDWASNVNMFDKLFVACEENKKAFARCGVTIPIVTVPLGVSPGLWPYKKRDKSGRPFRFLLFANSDWGQQRKNYSAAFDAFVAAFGNRTDVELIMKVTKGALPHCLSSQSNVKIIHGKYTQSQLLDLLHNVDCLLFPSKGEGFGLPPREAMATGIPVVAAGWGGLENIMKLDFNYSVPFTMTQATYAGSIDEWLVSHNQGSRDFGLWCDPSVSEMANILRSIPDDYGDVLSRGESCAKWIRENETYDICVQRLLDEIS
jgi:glycosyltransferase involved in cell wall biosynthesis